MSYVKKYYDAISKFKINIPTPVMAALEHLSASMLVACWLMLMTLCLNIFSSDMSIGNYVAQKVASVLMVVSEESIPELEAVKSTHRSCTFLKKFESTVKCCTQNGVRAVVQRFTSLFGTKK